LIYHQIEKQSALMAAQRLDGDKFSVVLLETYTNPVNIDDKDLANSIAVWARKYSVETVAYSRQTAGAVASRLIPAGIPTTPIDGALYTVRLAMKCCRQLPPNV